MCSTFETYASVRVLQWPQGGLVLAMMTKSQADDPKAENLRPLIGGHATPVLPYVLA